MDTGTVIGTYKDQDSTPFDLGPVIGSGGQCIVFKARKENNKPRQYPYAQKTMTIELEAGAVDIAKREFIEEVKILQHAQHFHVIQFTAAFEIKEDKAQLALVMQAARGDINDFLLGKRTKPDQIQSMRQWFHCLAGAVDYIHCLGIRHRDIKPQNILVGNKGEVLLADFGISRMGIIQTLSTTVPQWARSRTSSHCAPEVENGSSRGRSADIFSLGCVFLELLVACYDRDRIPDLAGSVTDPVTREKSYAKQIAKLEDWIKKFEQSSGVYLDHLGCTILSLCRRMLNEDRDERPQASVVLEELQQLQSSFPGQRRTPCKCHEIPPLTGNAALVEACKAGFLENVKQLVENNEAQASAIGALHQAAVHNHISIVEYLLGLDNFPVDLQDLSKQTALHCAASSGCAEMVNILLHHGATTNIQDIEGRTALHYAAGHGKFKIVEVLLNHKTLRVDVAIQDQDGRTALHFAAKRGHKAEVQILLEQLPSNFEKKEYADKCDKKQQTALHMAAGHGSLEVISELVKVNANFNAKDLRGWTALHFATRGKIPNEECKVICELLIEVGVKVEEKDKNMQTAAWGATREVCEMLGRAMGLTPDDAVQANITPSEPSCSHEVEDISGGNLPADFHPDFLSFITSCQYHKVDIWPLSWDSKLDMLGKGATGDVRQAIIDLESQFAFKRFISHRATRPDNAELPKLSTYNSNGKLFTSLVSEVVILNQPEIRRHEHIVNIAGIAFDIEGSSQDSLEVWPLLTMNKAQHGNLMNYVASERGRMLDFLSRLEFCAQIGSAISTMHSNNIVHGDIKPQNILIYEKDQTLIAKVTDFSYSCLGKSEEDIVTVPRSELWQAPEYSREGCKIRDAKLMDIYSFGMLCFWLLFPSEFGDLASTREALAEVQAKAENLASKQTLAELFDSKSLGKFFASTLCTNPQARNNDWQELVTFLGQRLWQPENEDNFFDGTRRLTLADYSATVDDIKDPKKLEALTSRILNSLHLTGTDYDTMRKHLDSTKFTNEQRTERYIDKILEGLSKFGFHSAEKDDEIRTQLKHSCLNLSSAFYQLIILDYRVRIYVVQCLEQRANGSCEQCAKAAALELAFCYTLGFGVMSNTVTAQTWLTRSGSTTDQLGERLEYLRNLTISDIETTTHARSGTKGNFAISYNVRYGSENFQSAEIHLSREIQDQEKYLGIDNWQLFELKLELVHLIWAQNKPEQATAMAEAYRISIQKRYGTEHMLHIRIMLVLADLYSEQSMWDDAEKLLLQSKRILVENIGLKHHLTLQACASLASTYVERGKNIEAEEEFQQIFNAIQGHLHSHHPISSEVTQRYANFLERQGRITDASVLRTQHNRGSLVSQNLKRLFEKHNDGRDARLRGDLDLAENMLSSVKREAELFVETHDVPDCREYMKVAMMATRNFALVIRDKKRLEEAETLQRELKGKIENELGAHDPETLNVTFDLARTLQIQEKWAEAERLQLAVKSVREALLSRTNEDTIISSRRLAEIYERQDKIDEAENERKWVRDAYMERFGPRHKDSIQATEKLALIYLQRGKLDQAEEACSEAALLYEDSLGPNDANALGFRSNLGAVYIGQGRLQEATELLEQTLEKMRNHLPREHQFINITKNHLANAYIRQGKIEEVGKLGILIQLPGAQQQAQMRVLSEDEQLQQAIQLSLRTEPGEQSARGESEEDEDLQRAIAMSLE